MEKINFHVVVSGNTSAYFKYLMANARHLAAEKQRLFFFCYALDEAAYALWSNERNVNKTVPVYRDGRAYRKRTWPEWKLYLRFLFGQAATLGGSNGHAAGLEAATRNLPNLGGHHIFADADTVLLSRNWDKRLCEIFANYELVGAPYEPMGGFSSGSGNVQTYKGFPSGVWVAFKQGLPWEHMSWWPKKESNIQITSEELSQTYNLPIGHELVRDVGWKLPGFCRTRNLKALAFQHVKSSSPKIDILKTGSDYNEEYQLDGNGFVGHQRGSSRHAFRGSPMSAKFYDIIEDRVGVPACIDE